MKTRRTFDTLAALTAALGLIVAGCRKPESPVTETPTAEGDPPRAVAVGGASYTISGPYTHENLTCFLVHGRDTTSEEYVTLAEGLESGAVVLTEKGGDVVAQVAEVPAADEPAGDEPAQSQAEIRSSGLRIGDVPQTNAVSQVGSGATVNELLIENTGNQAVYLQAGDVVKGGNQDRTIGQDIVLGPKSGKVPVSAFCVESGRWSTRSGQGLGFLASSYCVNTKGLKLAVMLDADQGKVWEEVAKAQTLLKYSVGEELADAASPTSLQLTLENDKLTTRVDEYGAALEAIVARHDDAIGYAFAVNGELNSADVYASNALFKKLWPKLLKASSTEAFGRIGGEKAAPGCSVDHVAACLSKTGGKETSKDAGGVTIVSRESKEDVVFETRVGAKPLRWNYLTK